ncbi:putative tubulin--tyrosine ligase C12B10.04 [Colletotrichum gloeosporioides]|uniref:Putative tubulin--tyrosine ligase C12B10.04 n=1 Tax=Colletotrichum gloeosporioides TaxID=474922 RepID=A0A8H4FH89_COLGL|nr:putative tubulin--tyrosine ligase C12B10.04 [Colletotrichum gloeosporioides]KAF3800899.1 putative tubulin--tyrosine ligase C12B10.04 [Colletotrichum gloeosporioides]
MHVYIQPAAPWLGEHIKSFIRNHVPDAIFIDDFEDFPSDASTVFQFCDGWALNRNFAALNTAEKALINAYPNSDALARKDYLARVVDFWTAKRPESILKKCVPLTVRLSLDYAEYVDDALTAADDLTLLCSLEDNADKPASEREWWILKPALVDCGAGIRLFSTMEELASHLELAEYEIDEDDESDLSYQAMLEANGKAEDDIIHDNSEGFYPTLSTPGLDTLDALVTATGELVLKEQKDGIQRAPKPQYVFKEGGRIPSAQMREFVAQRYIVHIPPMEKRKWHARAYVLAMGRLKVYVFKEMLALLAGEDYEPPWLNPSLKSSLTNTALQDEDVFINKQSMRDFWSAPDDLLPGDWKASVFEQICHTSAELFRGAAHTMADKFTTVDKCFELFAVDFLVDTDGTAWLLEVNETPAFYDVGMAGPLAMRLMESVIYLAMEHMGNAKLEEERNALAKKRMIQVLDETDKLAKSNITEILPEI